MLGSNEELEHNMQQKDALLQNDALTNMTNRTSNSSSSAEGSEESDGPVPFKINFRGTVWRRSMVSPTKKTTAQIIHTMNEKIYKLQDTKQVYTQYQRYRLLNITFGLSTMIPIFFTVITVDLDFNGNNPGLLNTLLMLGVWITVASIVLDIMRYLQKLRYKKAINEIPKETNLVTSGQIWFLLIEIIILMLVPLPWTANIMIQSYDEDDDAEYFFHFNDILSVFITLRFFFITRMILQGSQYMSPTVVRLSYFFGTRTSYTYAIKCMMRRHPIRTLFVNYFGSIIIFAYMIRICERPLILIPGNDTMQISDYWNALWYVIVTMTTVGYGDFYAHTNFGRLVSFFCCTWGAIIISVMVVVFTNVLEMDPAEKKILIIMERLLLRKRLKVQAAIVLQSVGRFLFQRNMRNYTDIQLKPYMAKIRENLKKFSELNLRIKAMNDRDNTNEEMARQFEFMRHEMREIKQALSTLNTLVRNRNLEQAFPAQPPHQIPAKDVHIK